MIGNRWNVIDGLGAMHLERMRSDVAQWRAYSPLVDPLNQALGELRDEAVILKHRQMNAALDGGYFGDLDRMADEIPDDAERALLSLDLGLFALSRLKSMEVGTGFGVGKKAHITVLEEGVVKLRERSRFKKPKPLEPGDEFSGIIHRLRSSPPEGGRLEVAPFIGPHTTILGLVDPETGNPRVELDILAAP